MLSIQLFGFPEVLRDGDPLRLVRRKSRAMLYYLAAQDRPIRREHVQVFFWPEATRASGQQNLRTTLHNLREVLGDVLHTDEGDIELDPEVRVDVHRFARVILSESPTIEELSRALELYRGSFLEGFYLPDSNNYEDWIALERERYRKLALRGYKTLSKLQEQSGKFSDALRSLDTALSFDPLQEDLQREAIRLAYLAGDRIDSIRRYDALIKMLDEELGVPPMLETRNLYDSILRDEPAQPVPAAKPSHQLGSPAVLKPDGSLPFAGRQTELERMGDPSTTGKLTLIEGEPGIGKTRLAMEFAQSSGALILQGTANELEQHLPYQPVIEALGRLPERQDWPALLQKLDLPPVWRTEVARLLPEVLDEQKLVAPPLPQTGSESRLWEGLHRFLSSLNELQPVIFFIDDLQWADQSTLGLLGYLVRQANGGIQYLAATRPFPVRSALASLVQSLQRSDRLLRITLSRLGKDEVLAIAARLAPRAAEPFCQWLLAQSEGNPYILSELVRYAREMKILHEGGQLDLAALSSSPVVPQTVYGLVQSRLANLSEPSRRILDAAVSAGREFDQEPVIRAAGLSEEAALDAFDELLASRMIAPNSRPPESGAAYPLTYRFDHSLTMEVAYKEAGETRHRLMHRRLADAYHEIYKNHPETVAGIIAFHYIEGNAPDKAVPFAVLAGQQAGKLAAWKEALEWYEAALQAAGDPALRRALLVSIGETGTLASNPARAADAYREALSLTEPGSRDADQIKLALGQNQLAAARYAETISLARQVLAGENSDLAVKANFLWGTALSLEGADLHEAEYRLKQAEANANLEVDSLQYAEIKFELGSVAAQEGDIQGAVELYRDSLSAARRAVDAGAGENAVMRLALAHNNLAYHLLLLDQVGEAEEWAKNGLEILQDNGILYIQTYLLSTLGEIALHRGELDQAQNYFTDGLALAERVSMPERVAGLNANLGLVARERGQESLAIYRLSSALAQADALGTQHLSAQVRIWLAPLLPKEEAQARLAEARAIAESGGRKKLIAEIEDISTQLAD